MSLASVFRPNDQINAQGYRLITYTLIENFWDADSPACSCHLVEFENLSAHQKFLMVVKIYYSLLFKIFNLHP